MHSVGDIPFTILVQEVREQYVLFQSLEPFLRSPLLLNSPMLCSLSPKIKEDLLLNYYEFDKEVMREILGMFCVLLDCNLFISANLQIL